MITGGSQQEPYWLARNGDGWVTYPRNVMAQQSIIESWRKRASELEAPYKPVSQSLYIDLIDDENASPQPIHLGFRSGVKHLREYLKSLEAIGVNHVAINLRFNQANIETTLKRLAEDILPDFNGKLAMNKRGHIMSKTILITGSTDGIGFETGKMLLSLGHKVLLHGRNATKLAEVEKMLSAISSTDQIESYVADLSSLKMLKHWHKPYQKTYTTRCVDKQCRDF